MWGTEPARDLCVQQQSLYTFMVYTGKPLPLCAPLIATRTWRGLKSHCVSVKDWSTCWNVCFGELELFKTWPNSVYPPWRIMIQSHGVQPAHYYPHWGAPHNIKCNANWGCSAASDGEYLFFLMPFYVKHCPFRHSDNCSDIFHLLILSPSALSLDCLFTYFVCCSQQTAVMPTPVEIFNSLVFVMEK